MGGIDDEWTRMVVTWKRVHKLASLSASESNLTKPPTSWRARNRDQEHVMKLKAGFQLSGSINKNIEAAFVSTKVYNEFREFVDAGGDPDVFVTSVAELIAKDPSAPIPGVFTGDHTVTAIGILAKAYPNNELWTKFRVDMYLCPKNPETDRLLTILGNQSNQQNKIFLTQDYPEIVTQMNRQLKVIQRTHHTEKERQAAIRNYKIDAARSLDIPAGSVGQIYQLAKLPDPLWVPLQKVLKGEQEAYSGPRPKKGAKAYQAKRIVSSHKFVPWCPLKTNLKLRLLNKILQGEWTVNMFHEECQRIRAHERIRTAISEFLLNTGVQLNESPDEFKASDVPIESYGDKWCNVLYTFPDIEMKVVRPWQTHVEKLRAKDDLPSEILNNVTKILKAKERQKGRVFLLL